VIDDKYLETKKGGVIMSAPVGSATAKPINIEHKLGPVVNTNPGGGKVAGADQGRGKVV